MVLCNLPSDSVWTQLDMELRYIGGSAADRCPLDIDLVDSGPCLPGQVRERSGGRAVNHAPVEGKLRPVAGTHEMLLAGIDCLRAGGVWTRACQRPQMTAISTAHES